MRRHRVHLEHHAVDRIGWLRASVLGANDGIVSTACLILGVAAAAAAPHDILVAGIAGLVAGAASMAAGEYVSVSSQLDSERADLAKETEELRDNPTFELEELTQIYVKRGVEHSVAHEVAKQLSAKDALEAHARDELGISATSRPRPVQASVASAASFSAGAAMPLLVVVISPQADLVPIVALVSLIALAVLGAVGARAGGAAMLSATIRVTLWGAVAMAVTAGIGRLVGTAV